MFIIIKVHIGLCSMAQMKLYQALDTQTILVSRITLVLVLIFSLTIF